MWLCIRAREVSMGAAALAVCVIYTYVLWTLHCLRRIRKSFSSLTIDRICFFFSKTKRLQTEHRKTKCAFVVVVAAVVVDFYRYSSIGCQKIFIVVAASFSLSSLFCSVRPFQTRDEKNYTYLSNRIITENSLCDYRAGGGGGVALWWLRMNWSKRRMSHMKKQRTHTCAYMYECWSDTYWNMHFSNDDCRRRRRCLGLCFSTEIHQYHFFKTNTTMSFCSSNLGKLLVRCCRRFF